LPNWWLFYVGLGSVLLGFIALGVELAIRRKAWVDGEIHTELVGISGPARWILWIIGALLMAFASGLWPCMTAMIATRLPFTEKRDRQRILELG
jgi:MFS family permease